VLSNLENEERAQIQRLLSLSPRPNSGLQYEIEKHPENYVRMAIGFSRLFEDLGLKPFIACPVRTSHIQSEVIIDTKIIWTCPQAVLEGKRL
jgi:hypothetical protein